jgi:hypothetical protein
LITRCVPTMTHKTACATNKYCKRSDHSD